ncbi:MAG: cupin domain-containing protein [Deltaproteobacteria bacterium]|nr:MAG: cupin domain-containing protein [Deltaproteobacteria bacterium]
MDPKHPDPGSEAPLPGAPAPGTPPIRILLYVAPLAFLGMVVAAIVAAGAIAGETAERKDAFVRRAEDFVAHSILGGQGAARILVDKSRSDRASLTDLLLAPGASIPPRTESEQDTLFYVIRGVAKVTVDGRQRAARPGDAVHIPAGKRYSVLSAGRFEPLRLVLVHVGPGPEQRFTDGAPTAME